ncbi:hypothetical protein [Variovorax sp. Root318D1]|uniref:hypothetical protein n=1 Tax=Variovorax sp. Root318D1 TaxID=1736513 RepID=UPI001F212132|nr:hypothetical protein [Variovorax sp. Root318D1]
MTPQQANSDERDNQRVFRWGIGAALIIFLLALAYNFLIQTREEGPVKPSTPTQSAPLVAPSGTAPQSAPSSTAPQTVPSTTAPQTPPAPANTQGK